MSVRISFLPPLIGLACLSLAPVFGTVDEALRLERSGSPREARQALDRLAESSAAGTATLAARAAFLDRYGDGAAIAAYAAALAAAEGEDPDLALALRRRLAIASLVHGDTASAKQALEAMRAGGNDAWDGIEAMVAASEAAASDEWVDVPGTLNSFQRMAALSTDMAIGDILPSLGRTIFTGGYHAARGTGALEPTEIGRAHV